MSNQLLLNPLNTITGSFQSYVSFAYSQPSLNAEQEKDLFKRYHEENDLNAAQQIILAHLRFVVFVANRYKGYGLSCEELVQEGSVGLLKSLKRFDIHVGVRFATFAVHYIKAEIQEFIVKNWRLVKVATTKAQRKLFFNLRSLKKRMEWMNRDEVKEVAQYLKVKEEEVTEMELRLRQCDEYLELTSVDSCAQETQAKLSLIRGLDDHSLTPEILLMEKDVQEKLSKLLKDFLCTLNEREHDILVGRWFYRDEAQRANLKDFANKYGISLERVRQIEMNALSKMKEFLEKNGISHEDCI